MTESLGAAKDLAERIRFSGDTLRPNERSSLTKTETFKNLFFQHELHIAHDVTPALADRLDDVFERLRIGDHSVEAFVYASPEIQASCYAGSDSECVIRFSSSLIDLLDEEEFGFVAGHELGHFLLGHGIARSEAENASVEHLMQQRSQEISVDRTGLLACGSLDVGIRALMKTSSGLNSRHLRFDVGTFISQIRKVRDSRAHGSTAVSHPSILIRCRALLWFSMSDFFTSGTTDSFEEQMAKLDGRIREDLSKYVDGPAQRLIQEARDDVALWMAVYEVVQDGSFTKRDQETIAEVFGEEILEKVKNFLSDLSASEASRAIFEKMESSRNELEKLIPNGFEAEVESVKRSISAKFS